MMTVVTRSKLTIAAEIAAVGAFVIAVLAIVVTVFFDTGIRLPWNTEGHSPSSVVTSPAATSTTPSVGQSTTTTQPTTSSQPQSIPDSGEQTATPVAHNWLGTKLAAIKQFGDGANFWVVALFALFALLAMRLILGALYHFFIPISLVSNILMGIVPVGAIGSLYLWTFWSTLSELGVASFVLGATVTFVYSIVQS